LNCAKFLGYLFKLKKTGNLLGRSHNLLSTDDSTNCPT
jgi:hypothetical protein